MVRTHFRTFTDCYINKDKLSLVLVLEDADATVHVRGTKVYKQINHNPTWLNATTTEASIGYCLEEVRGNGDQLCLRELWKVPVL